MVAEQKANTYTLKVFFGVAASQLSSDDAGAQNAIAIPNPEARLDTVTGDPAVMAQLRENLVLDVQEAYRRSELANANATIAAPQSGIAKAYDFRELEALLSGLARTTEAAENRLLEMWARAAGQEALVDRIAASSYTDTFDLLGGEARTEQLWRVVDGRDLPIELRREALRTLSLNIWPDETDRRQAALDAVDGWRASLGQQMLARLPGARPGAPGPGSTPQPGGPVVPFARAGAAAARAATATRTDLT
jgi:hypothetical protein